MGEVLEKFIKGKATDGFFLFESHSGGLMLTLFFFLVRAQR